MDHPVGPAQPEQRRHDEPAHADPKRCPRGIFGERYVFHEGGDGEVYPVFEMHVPSSDGGNLFKNYLRITRYFIS